MGNTFIKRNIGKSNVSCISIEDKKHTEINKYNAWLQWQMHKCNQTENRMCGFVSGFVRVQR